MKFTRIGYGLLLFYGIVAFLLRNHQTFMDEGSNLNLAFCVLRGMHLYRDVFENHFPLPVYVGAAITLITDASLPLVRLAVLLIDAAMLLAAMRITRLAFPIGFAAAVWSLISAYYFGNMLLYDNLAMIAAIAMGATCFAILSRGLAPSHGTFALLAVTGFIGTMSSPFFALTAAIAIGSLLFAPHIPRAFVVKVSLAIATPVACYFLYLGITGALGSFYSYAVVFNTTTYQKYVETPLEILPNIFRQLLFLDILNANWIRSFNPLKFNPVSFTPAFDHWIFSGLFYRVAALGACLLFAMRRDYRTAAFLYLFTASLPLREDQQFHAAPFVLFSLFLAGVLIEQANLAARAAVIACTLILAISGARYVAKHALESDFEPLLANARIIKEAAQGQTDVQLGHYPDGNYMYYLTGFRPLSKFVDFYPWVAEIAKPDVDADLARAPRVILAMDVVGQIWKRPNAETFASEIAYARSQLIKERFVKTILYVSPSLAAKEHVITAFVSSRSSKPGTFRNGEWRLVGNPDAPDGPETRTFRFWGQAGDLPVTGDWSGTGKTTIGLYRPSTSEWLLGNGKVFEIPGQPGDLPVTGDWTGDGKTKIGIYRPSTGEWLLDYNGAGAYSKTCKFGGAPGDMPVTGDWTGVGKTKIGIVHKNFQWILDTNGDGILDEKTDTVFFLGGLPGDVPVTGDWTGTGRTFPGIFRQSSSWLFDIDGDHQYVDAKDAWLAFGSNGDKPVTGAW